MGSEPWEDAVLSAELGRMAASGEGQALEFKAELPKHISRLADEVAAFSTSNDGTIILGVADDGTIVGLAGVANPRARDAFAERVRGVIAQVKPAPRTSLQWASSNGNAVLAVQVHRGVQPVYYSQCRPMVRDHASSRPATPDEVIEAVRRYLATCNPKLDAEAEFVSATAKLIAELIGWCDTPGQMLDLDPWCGMWRSLAGAGADRLRDAAVDEVALRLKHDRHLNAAAKALHIVGAFRHFFGSGGSFREATADARRCLEHSFAQLTVSTPLDADSLAALTASAEKACRKLEEGWARAAAEPFSGQLEKMVEESSAQGRDLLRYTYFELGSVATAEQLRSACLLMIGLQERRMYMDGGASQAAAIEAGQGGIAALCSAAAALRQHIQKGRG